MLVAPSGRIVVGDGPLSFGRSLLALLNRMLGFLVMMGAPEVKRHVGILDTTLHLELDIAAQLEHARGGGGATPATPCCDTGRRYSLYLLY